MVIKLVKHTQNKIMTNKKQIKSTLTWIDMLIREYDNRRDSAISQKLWSQVAGLDGISTGLIIAKHVIERDLLNKKK